MNKHRRVLWSEGLFLRPQHFQSQDAYHEARLAQTRHDLHPYAWGLRQAEFDAEALANGVLRPSRLAAVFDDGEAFDAPGQDELPQAISLENMPTDSRHLVVYLGLPRWRGQGGNLADPDVLQPHDVRYSQAPQAVNDHFTDAEDAEVFFLCKRARLLTELDQRAEFVCLPVARLQRAPTGGLQLDARFLPPVLSIEASAWLHRQLRLLLDALQAKVDALYSHHRQTGEGTLEFRHNDVASFWLLHTSTASFAQLLHLLQHPSLHPERLFQVMLQLAGSLMSFSKLFSLADLPAYRHDAPELGFRNLISMVRKLLEAVVPQNFCSIPLTESRPGFHAGRLESDKLDEQSRFYLSVAGDLGPAELAQCVPQRIKLGAPDDVEACVLSALPGIELTYLPRAPSAVPARAGRQYFELASKGPLYERMLKARSVTVYVPSGMQGIDLELLAVTR